MNSKKITIIIVVIILVVTAAILSIKFAQKNAEVPAVSKSPIGVSQMAKKGTENAAQSPQEKAIQADPDTKALESDLNSVSADDFSDNSLSDQNVGL